MTIDGSTQREFVDRPVIAVVSDTQASGLVLQNTAPQSTIRSLSITGWAYGIKILADFVTVVGSYVGLKPDGTVPAVRNNIGILLGDELMEFLFRRRCDHRRNASEGPQCHFWQPDSRYFDAR